MIANIRFKSPARALALAIFISGASQAWSFTPVAPPPAPPVQYQQASKQSVQSFGYALSGTLYSIGDPTDIEQLYLEYINRARANPNAEAQRLKNTTDPNVLSAYTQFSVDLNLMVSQFGTLSVAPPLAFNAKLIASARAHTQDMFTNAYQGHNGTDSSTISSRITAQGYSWSAIGENVYSYSVSTFYGHAGFEVDWGYGTGGMQTPPGHRNNIHSTTFREIGVGVVLGTNALTTGTVGPQLVTQDFGVQLSPTPIISGVAYYDLKNSGFYDVGEGIGGVTVSVSGANYYAVTGTSGGYSVPVPGNGAYTVTFSTPGLADVQSLVSVVNGTNVKVDYVPTYTAPSLIGPGALAPGQSGSFAFNTVGAATGYQWKQVTLLPYTLVEGAENGLTNVTASVSSGYSLIETDTVKNGTHAFHLAQPDGTTQTLQLNHTLRIASNSTLTFWSMLGWATPVQVAAAQISTDGGNQWQDLWTQAGTDTEGETSFSQKTIPLSSFAGQDALLRFQYRFDSGSLYNQTDPGVGLYLDDITVTNAQDETAPTITQTATNSFPFSSGTAANYLLAVRPLLPGRTFPWGTAQTVAVASQAAYAQWAGGYFTAQQLADSQTGTLAAVPQKDGVPNILKYFCNINPATPMSASSRAALPAVGLETTSGTTYLTLTYRQNALVSGTMAKLLTSSTLGSGSWQTVVPDVTQALGTDPVTGDPLIRVKVNANGATRKFLRLQLSQP